MNENSRVMRLAFATLCSGMFLLAGCDNDQAKAGGALPEVGVVKLKAEKLALTTELPGRTRPYRVAEVRPQVSGIILKRQFTEGSDVIAGQSLYQIDPATYQTAFDSAQGELAKAQASADISHLTVKRYTPLLGTHYVSPQDYDKAVANAKQADAAVVAAKAGLEQARINLLYTKMSSPISGRIGKSSVTEGALVTAGQPKALASVQQLDPIYVDVTQSSTDFLNLKRELAKGSLKQNAESVVVDLILDDGSLYKQKGTLQFSDVTVDETTGSITLRAIFPNPNQELLPGMFVHARIQEGVKENALLAPQQGITRNARGQATALVVDEQGKVVLRTLATGQAIGDKWLVASGLTAGEQIIVTGQLKIRPGMAVKAVESDDESKTKAAADKAPISAHVSG
ncbi:Acriflavine resistance protein A precursor [Legionella massiliensis]|uniref:Acriflavine resistance protein A n=1 Tax=Legionella massiliensis TaxID=1034943 RepID=A0A078KW33_9GAMM|nr:efflux RND transporter periplasmic adaptor subunit [Legionella massiliensis]CDZ78665.1 Acriflavine resistance protein A precursor [Legionella massiliensis]CEE14403.1 Multidrug efflux pump subunit AcrA precursor [Legionella massiliensis]